MEKYISEELCRLQAQREKKQQTFEMFKESVALKQAYQEQQQHAELREQKRIEEFQRH